MPNIAPHRRARSDGMTLIEVMAALAVLAFGLIAMLAMQMQAMRGGAEGRHSTEAVRIAEAQMEFLQGLPWNDPRMAPTPWTPAAPGQAVLLGNADNSGQAQPQTYNMQWRITATADTQVRMIDVQINWLEPNEPAGRPPHRFAISSSRYNGP